MAAYMHGIHVRSYSDFTNTLRHWPYPLLTLTFSFTSFCCHCSRGCLKGITPPGTGVGSTEEASDYAAPDSFVDTCFFCCLRWLYALWCSGMAGRTLLIMILVFWPAILEHGRAPPRFEDASHIRGIPCFKTLINHTQSAGRTWRTINQSAGEVPVIPN